MHSRRVLRLIVAIELASCGLVQAQSHQWTEKGGTQTDPRTGVSFPMHVASFTRYGAVEYDQLGYPMAEYTTASLIFASVFYYKEDPFEAEYAGARKAVTQGSWHARLISDGRSNLRPAGRHAVFTFEQTSTGGGKEKFMSELLMFPHRGRYLKFRITYPAAIKAGARREIDAFVRAFPLP